MCWDKYYFPFSGLVHFNDKESFSFHSTWIFGFFICPGFEIAETSVFTPTQGRNNIQFCFCSRLDIIFFFQKQCCHYSIRMLTVFSGKKGPLEIVHSDACGCQSGALFLEKKDVSGASFKTSGSKWENMILFLFCFYHLGEWILYFLLLLFVLCIHEKVHH